MRLRQSHIAIATILAATAFLFWPITSALLAGADPPWFEWDVPEQYWPDLVYVCESVHDGQLPYWNPYDRGGYPFYADPQSASYHPLTWLSCGLGGPSPVLDWAVLRVILGFAMSGLFGLLWLRRLEVPWSGAVVGAVLIEAAPFMRHNWELNLTTALAYLPLMLWAADRLAVERHVGDGAVLAIAVALCGWVGSPPALFFAGALCGLYLVFRLATSGPGWTDALPGIGVAALLTAGLLAVVLIPTARLAEHSVQAGRSLESIADGGLTLERTAALLWPQPGNHLYVGWLALLAIPFALRSRERRLAGFFLAVAVVAVLLAMGTHGPLFEAAFHLVPGVDRFRLPHRYEAWLGPAAAILVGLGASALGPSRRADPTRERSIGAVLLGVGAGLVIASGLVELDARGPGALLGALGVIVTARTLPRPFDQHGAIAGAAVVVFLLADLSQAMPADRHLREGPPPVSAEEELLAHAEGIDHTMMEFGLCCRGGTRHRRPDLRGYQDPLALKSWERVMSSLREVPALAPQYNVRWAIVGPHFIHGWDRHFLPPPSLLRQRLRTARRYDDVRDRQVIELLDALPPAYFVPAGQVERARHRPAALARVRNLAPAAVAILEGEPTGHRAADTRVPITSAVTFGRSPDRIRLTIRAPEDGVVVVNEAYYPGWTATVDGEPTRVLRANGFVRALRVGPGHHEIAMEFRPPEGRKLRVVLIAAWAACLLLVAWRVFGLAQASRRRRPPGGSAPPLAERGTRGPRPTR